MVTSFATISSSFARLPEQQLPLPICYALVLGWQFWVGALAEPCNRFSFRSQGGSARRACAKGRRHVRAHMPTYANTFTRMSAHPDKCSLLASYGCSNPSTTKRTLPPPPPPRRTHALAGTRVSAHLPSRRSFHTSHINRLASVTGGHTYTPARAHAGKDEHTQAHAAVLLSGASVPF